MSLNPKALTPENVHGSDLLAFLLIVFLAMNSEARGFKIPSILRTIAEDSTRYFLVIFTSHFVLEMTLNLGRVSVNSFISSPRLQSTILNAEY